MWSDPVDNETGYQDKEYLPNKRRSCSYFFGNTATNHLLEKNNLLCVVRAHEV